MDQGDTAGLIFGILTIAGGAALAYRYTLSAKAAERMAEANRNYVPPVEKPMTPRRALIYNGPLFVARFAAAAVTGFEVLWILAIVMGAVEAYVVYKALQRDRARGGTRTPTSEDTGT